MPTSNMKLPDAADVMIDRDIIQKHEWRMDPPPHIIKYVKPDILFDIYQSQLKAFEEIAKINMEIKKLEAQKIQVEARMFDTVSELMIKR